MTDILDNAAKQMREQKVKDATEKMKALEEEMGVVFQAKLAFSESGVVPYIAILNAADAKTERNSKG